MINAILTSLFLASLSFAQGTDYVIQQWKVENGLPQSTVRCISQTPDGYIWAGTWDGLARFDGIRMTVFNASNTPALLSSNIMSIWCDDRDQLWIGTDAGGLVCYAGGKFQRYDSTNGISATRILSINQDRIGNIWCATELGIYMYDGTTFHRFTEANGLPHTYANQVMPYTDGSMYLGFVSYGSKVRLKKSSLIIEQSFPVGGYRVAIDSNGTLWYGIRGKGFVQWNNRDEIVDHRFAGITMGETYILRNGEKWLFTADDIRIFSSKTERTMTSIDGISFAGMTTLFEDREGNIWLGKEGGGLILLRQKHITVLSKKNGSPFNLVMTGLEDTARNVWIGTWDAGLQRLSSSAGTFTSIPLPNKNATSIYTLWRSSKGTVYAGVWGAGLYRIQGNRVEQFLQGMIGPTTSIVSGAEDIHGGLWIGTAHDGAVHLLRGKETRWNTEQGLSSNRVNSILCTRNGDTWISVSANGVNRISNGILTVFKKGSGLNDNFASPLYEDGDGAVWIGTKRGLNRWKNGKFSTVTAQQGLFDEAIAQMIEDDFGYFWIGATHGIYRVSAQELNDAAEGKITTVRCLTIGKEDGMLNEETGGGSPRCWKRSDGTLWFSTSEGVVVVNPRKISSASHPPSVMIEDVWIENSPVPVDNSIVLQPGQSKIELRYSGIHFTSPSKIRFKYFLEGWDDAWHDAGTQRFVQYTNLDPGEYVFHLQAVNNAGMESPDEASLTFVVLPPFYATWWFRIFSIIVLIAAAWFAVHRRISAIERRQKLQQDFTRRLIENQESERKRIASELHDGLGQNLLIIKNKLLLALQSLSHEQQSSLHVEDASQIASETINEVRSISHNLRPHQLDQLGITKTLRSIVRQAKESTRMEFTANIQDIDNVLPPEQEISLFRIMQEAFNNIIKHSGATRVMVTVLRNDPMISVSISDNGIGYDSETLQSTSSAMGFGISGMKERAKMFGWEFTIQSSSLGTVILVTIDTRAIPLEPSKK